MLQPVSMTEFLPSQKCFAKPITLKTVEGGLSKEERQTALVASSEESFHA
jgi:hypothetical protein